MSDEQLPPRDAANWAHRTEGLKVGALPPEAVNLNVDGRQVVGPLQGFGQLWQKTYRVRLEGCAATPEEAIAVWKANFPAFQPPQNRFFLSVAGVAPGEVVLINASLQGIPMQTGVLVLYADDVSFTLMTPQGHPESGWVTFSASDEGWLHRLPGAKHGPRQRPALRAGLRPGRLGGPGGDLAPRADQPGGPSRRARTARAAREAVRGPAGPMGPGWQRSSQRGDPLPAVCYNTVVPPGVGSSWNAPLVSP